MTNGIIKSKVLSCVDILRTAALNRTLDVCHHCYLPAVGFEVWICNFRDCEVLQVEMMHHVFIFSGKQYYWVATLRCLNQLIISS